MIFSDFKNCCVLFSTAFWLVFSLPSSWNDWPVQKHDIYVNYRRLVDKTNKKLYEYIRLPALCKHVTISFSIASNAWILSNGLWDIFYVFYYYSHLWTQTKIIFFIFSVRLLLPRNNSKSPPAARNGNDRNVKVLCVNYTVGCVRIAIYVYFKLLRSARIDV